jgi:hypothetical protein
VARTAEESAGSATAVDDPDASPETVATGAEPSSPGAVGGVGADPADDGKPVVGSVGTSAVGNEPTMVETGAGTAASTPSTVESTVDSAPLIVTFTLSRRGFTTDVTTVGTNDWATGVVVTRGEAATAFVVFVTIAVVVVVTRAAAFVAVVTVAATWLSGPDIAAFVAVDAAGPDFGAVA